MRRTLPGAIVLAFVSSAIVFFIVTDSFTDPEHGLDAWAFAVLAGGSIAFGGVGQVITTRAPVLPIGWLFLGTALAGGLGLVLYAPDRLPDIGNAIGFCMAIGAIAGLSSFPAADSKAGGGGWPWLSWSPVPLR